jgi:hypothetical protein
MDDFPPAPLNTVARLVTLMVFLMAAFFGFLAFRQSDFPLYAAALIPLVIFITWGFSTRGYSLEDGKLVVHRPFISRRISLAPGLTAVPDPDAGKGAVRVMGNGGLFGYYGTFRSGRLGTFSAHATDWKFGVVVRTGGKTYVLTPEEPEMFVTRLEETAGTLE